MPNASLLGKRHQFLRHGLAGRQRPFAVHIFAGGDGCSYGGLVLGCRVEHEHQIHLRMIDQRLHGIECKADAVAQCQLGGFFRAATVDCRQLIVGKQLEGGQVAVLGPMTDANETHSNFF
ncbi:hypothetical protein D3C72_1358030 [compost metagenome]